MDGPSSETSSAATAPIAIPSRHSQRHQPVKIHTMHSSSYSSLNLSRSPPSGSFLHSPPPVTAVNPNLAPFNNVGRSRSSSRSGGVVYTTRPRADSEAARTAMEAMVQARLDRIRKRLHNFNTQSQELQEKTEQLADVFHEKAKRLYVVEDHMLRLQGKPGLSEEYLANGPRPRRLTNDLEELRMGVKTLRGKFQAAGSAVATIEWWKQLKGSKDQLSASSTSLNNESIDNGIDGATPPEFSNTKERVALQHIFTNPNPSPPPPSQMASSPKSSFEDEGRQTSGLRSPPLTPKAPLSGSSLLSKGLEDRHYLRSRPLSIIPDLEESYQFPSTDATTPDTLSLAGGNRFPQTKLPSGSVAVGSFSEQQDIIMHEQDGEPQPRNSSVLTPPSPGSPVFGETKSAVNQRKTAQNADLSSASREPSAKGDYESTKRVQVLDGLDVSTLQTQATTGDNDAWEEVDDKPRARRSGTGATTYNWIQAFWQLFIRAEYLLLGTAVLGAMMPDNVYALVAGFISAIMYGILLIHHRLTAPPGKEAPQPPTGKDADRKKSLANNTATTANATASYKASHSSASRRGVPLQ